VRRRIHNRTLLCFFASFYVWYSIPTCSVMDYTCVMVDCAVTMKKVEEGMEEKQTRGDRRQKIKRNRQTDRQAGRRRGQVSYLLFSFFAVGQNIDLLSINPASHFDMSSDPAPEPDLLSFRALRILASASSRSRLILAVSALAAALAAC
jgi:hypothetical protein